MADRPAPENGEIEITPAMIEAGLSPLFRFHRETHIAEETVAEIYTVMTKARRHTVERDRRK